MKKTYTALFTITGCMALVLSLNSKGMKRFHSDKELSSFSHMMRTGGPHGVNDFFGGSGLCMGCHGHDENNLAMVTPWGQDVNVYDGWAGTMMANSAKDPFWRAKVSHEILVNPAHSLEFQNKCTSCHAPLGHFTAFYSGLSPYALAQMDMDSLARDGVSCGACHQLKDTLIGKRFSGNLIYDTTKTVYGPFPSPFAGPMQSFVGFDVKKGNHITNAGLCAGCHTLITESHDLTGNPTGTHFVEQATYHEWLNSIYNTETSPSTGRTCQSCHMPRIDEDIIIAANYAFLSGRRPYGQHHLVGANTFMLNLMKNNISPLGITATAAHFDSAIVRTTRLMQDSAVVMELTLVNRTPDTAYYDLKLTNKAGHKFPSGYPSRRAFVQFVLLNAAGDTIFKNGMLNSAWQLIGQDATYENHHDVIKQPNDVQIYELVAGDVNGDVTTVLERMYSMLKDNRLTPTGFSTTHPAYDTTKIVGGATTDADFNYTGGVEGSGSDIVHFRVPLAGYAGNLNVMAALYYQSVPHKWLDEMFSFSSPEIGAFQSMFNAADHAPLLVAQIKEGDLYTGINEQVPLVKPVVYPNPSNNGMFKVNTPLPVDEITVYSILGTQELVVKNSSEFILTRRGTYIVRIRSGHKQFVEKVIFR